MSSNQPNPTEPEIDRCAFCLGAKGGKLGAENVIQGVLVCVACTELFMDIHTVMQQNVVRPPPLDVMSGQVHDEESSEIGALVRGATDTAHDHAEQESSGQRYGLMSAGGPVTDPLEIEMYRKLKEQNIAVCAHCYNTGWKLEGQVYCECPVGEFLAAKTAQLDPTDGK
jgi:hypothetical protein